MTMVARFTLQNGETVYPILYKFMGSWDKRILLMRRIKKQGIWGCGIGPIDSWDDYFSIFGSPFLGSNTVDHIVDNITMITDWHIENGKKILLEGTIPGLAGT